VKITKPGIYKNFDTRAYFDDPCPSPALSQSIAKTLIEQSPLHAKQAHPRLAQPIDGDEETTEKYEKAKAIGNAAHAIMLGRGKTLAVIDQESFRTKSAQNDRDAAVQRGEEPILRRHWNIAHAMTLAAKLQLLQIEGCERAFKDGDGEVVIANCEDGVWLKSMVDWITPDLREVWDYKTTGGSASPYVTGKKMADDGWAIQAGAIERILDAIDREGAGRRKFRFVLQEQDPPFSLTVNEIGEGALTMGRKMFDYAAKAWRVSLETGCWPAYPPRIIIPQFPGWKENAWLEREIAEDDAGTTPQPRKQLASLAGG
jgi:hypothetical protein